MPRLFPLVPPMEITTGRVDAIPTKYEKISEYVTTLTIGTGESVATGLITLPVNVEASEIKTIRAFCTGNTFTLFLNDISGQPFYAFQNATEALVDNMIEIPVTGNIGIYVSTATGVTAATPIDIKVGVRHFVEKA